MMVARWINIHLAGVTVAILLVVVGVFKMKEETITKVVDVQECYIQHKLLGLDKLTKQIKRLCDLLEKKNE